MKTAVMGSARGELLPLAHRVGSCGAKHRSANGDVTDFCPGDIRAAAQGGSGSYWLCQSKEFFSSECTKETEELVEAGRTRDQVQRGITRETLLPHQSRVSVAGVKPSEGHRQRGAQG